MGYKPHSIKDRSILQILLVGNSKSYEKPDAVQRRREKRFKLCLGNLAYRVWKVHLAPALEACLPREMLKRTLGLRERDSVHLILPAGPPRRGHNSFTHYRKIPKISPGAYIFQTPFLRGLFLEGLICGGKSASQNR